MDYTWHYDSPLGGITLASDGEALVGLWFDGQQHFADTLENEHQEKMLPVIREACRWLDIYFSGQKPGFTPEIKPRGTEFRRRVWKTLTAIPYGNTITYGDIARMMDRETGCKKMSARAIGGAVSHNPISLIIPCHRVVGSGNRLTGYAGGIEKKKWLLEQEKSAMEKSRFTIRKARKEDIPAMMDIFAYARNFMRNTGNPDQWADNYPGRELLESDIESGDSHVVEEGGEIIATFVLRPGKDPTYDIIYNGSWPNDLPYATIHRIASSGKRRGILHTAMQYALGTYTSIRIDTHKDNIVMQNAIAKEGFTYCGIIRCWNGSERLAYQYTKP